MDQPQAASSLAGVLHQTIMPDRLPKTVFTEAQLESIVVKLRIMVVYDSVYGDTGTIAEAIGKSLESLHEVLVVEAHDATIPDVEKADLLIIGSPTHGGRATKDIETFIGKIPSVTVSRLKFAAFDTRMPIEEQGAGLRFLMKAIGFAAEKMSKELVSKGASRQAEPEGFLVLEREGPLKEGEADRASTWALSVTGDAELLRAARK